MFWDITKLPNGKLEIQDTRPGNEEGERAP
jgi:hypothetical protein